MNRSTAHRALLNAFIPAILVLGPGVVTAWASPGALDNSLGGFGNDGTLGFAYHLVAQALQPDGKLVLVGTEGTGLRVTRRRQNGSADPTFGSNGTAIISAPGFNAAVPKSVAIQPDGKIVIAGYFDNHPADMMVARLTPTGALDPSFAAGGWNGVQIGTDSDIANKVLIQPDGKIILAGMSYVGGDWDFAVARLTSEGVPDPSFNDDGRAVIGFGGDDKCYGAALQADGKLVLVGFNEGLVDDDFAVARLDAAGHLDNSFAGGGKLTTGFGDYDDARAVAIQPDGRIVVTGYHAIARYLSNGSLDASFGSGGKKSLDHDCHDVAVEPNGTIMLIGNSVVNSNDFYKFELIFMNPDGSAFQSPYSDRRTIATSYDQADWPSLALMADGRILAMVPDSTLCTVTRVYPDNQMDQAGYESAAFDDFRFPAGSNEGANALAVQSDGAIVLAGEVAKSGGGETDVAVVRLLADGSYDGSFGIAGRTVFSLRSYNTARGVAVQQDGKIIVAGYTGSGSGTDFLVARFAADGSLDASFGPGGYRLVDFLGDADYGWVLAMAPDGKIVMAGTVSLGTGSYFGVARFNSDGTPDATFDTDGKQLVLISPGQSHWCTSVVVQPDLKIILGGYVGTDFGLVRLNTNGSLDPTFGSNGKVVTDMGGSDYLNALGLAANGEIYAAGTRDLSGHSVIAIAQYRSNGALEGNCSRGQPCGHWPNGTTTFDYLGASTSGFAIDVRGDGQVLVAGCSTIKPVWFQLSPTDPTPSMKGGFIFANAVGACATATRFVGMNHFLIAGYQTLSGDRSMILGRYETTADVSGVGDLPAGAVTSLRMEKPYPNPAHRRSTLSFEIPSSGPARLELYDVAGRLVRTLINESLSAGPHQVDWDGTDDHGAPVANGVYLARVTEHGESATQPIIEVH